MWEPEVCMMDGIVAPLSHEATTHPPPCRDWQPWNDADRKLRVKRVGAQLIIRSHATMPCKAQHKAIHCVPSTYKHYVEPELEFARTIAMLCPTHPHPILTNSLSCIPAPSHGDHDRANGASCCSLTLTPTRKRQTKNNHNNHTTHLGDAG